MMNDFQHTTEDVLGYFLEGADVGMPMPDISYGTDQWANVETVDSGSIHHIKIEPHAETDASTGSEPSSPEPLTAFDHLNNMGLCSMEMRSSISPQLLHKRHDEHGLNKNDSRMDCEDEDDLLSYHGNDDSLKTLSSTADLERYTQVLRSTRNLSKEEEQVLKRQRRLIKNRESAQKSRLRKKRYVEELERKVQLMADENQRLNTANELLKEDVGYLARIIRTKNPEMSEDVLKGLHRKSSASPKSSKAAGLCLLLVLCSFGIFFNSKENNANSSLPISFGLDHGLPLPGDLLSAASSSSITSSNSVRGFGAVKQEPLTDDEDNELGFHYKKKRKRGAADIDTDCSLPQEKIRRIGSRISLANNSDSDGGEEFPKDAFLSLATAPCDLRASSESGRAKEHTFLFCTEAPPHGGTEDGGMVITPLMHGIVGDRGEQQLLPSDRNHSPLAVSCKIVNMSIYS
eukprot:TRINITY_DN617_c0_g1_i1.p1 TRINITY_DN617_c0_g1~~TRINITY_DN617_c0_g1_i1.p1  ORF type:complete len:460 (-),score=75.11 TRINITY_DN617_c0_g1_i1:85-1464(-)